MIKILYVEDDVNLAFLTRDNLVRAGYNVDYCNNGKEALAKIQGNDFDLYILDVMLPKIDGFTLASKIREINKEVPILFLSAKSTIEDKISGLQLGADDYITKPFSIEELILKIEIFLKRSKFDPIKNNSMNVKIGIFTFSINSFELTYKDKTEQLTYREAKLLEYFYNNTGKILTRDNILNNVWGNNHFFSSRTLDVFISRLRKILKPDPLIKIESIHNVGYRFLYNLN